MRLADRPLQRDRERLYGQPWYVPAPWLIYRVAEHESGDGGNVLAGRLLRKTPAANALFERCASISGLNWLFYASLPARLRVTAIMSRLSAARQRRYGARSALWTDCAYSPEVFAQHALEVGGGGSEMIYSWSLPAASPFCDPRVDPTIRP